MHTCCTDRIECNIVLYGSSCLQPLPKHDHHHRHHHHHSGEHSHGQDGNHHHHQALPQDRAQTAIECSLHPSLDKWLKTKDLTSAQSPVPVQTAESWPVTSLKPNSKQRPLQSPSQRCPPHKSRPLHHHHPNQPQRPWSLQETPIPTSKSPA